MLKPNKEFFDSFKRDVEYKIRCKSDGYKQQQMFQVEQMKTAMDILQNKFEKDKYLSVIRAVDDMSVNLNSLCEEFHWRIPISLFFTEN